MHAMDDARACVCDQEVANKKKMPNSFTLFFIITTVVLRAVGGEVGSASTLAPKVGPLGLVSLLLVVYVYVCVCMCVSFSFHLAP